MYPNFFLFLLLFTIFSILIFQSASAICRYPVLVLQTPPLLADFLELFTLPEILRLNTQRRSAPSMCAFKEEERSVLISVTLMKRITGFKTVPTIGITFCM